MSSYLIRRATALVAVCFAACASPSPPALVVGHPAHTQSTAAPLPKLQTLSSYRDFGAQAVLPRASADGNAKPAAPAVPPAEEHPDAHKH